MHTLIDSPTAQVAVSPSTPAPGEAVTLTNLEVLTPATPGQIDAQSDRFSRARLFVGSAAMAAKMTVAFQVLTGFELAAIKAELGYTRGGDRKSKPKDSGLIPWPELVKRELGISDDTARNWMLMAEASKQRLKKLEGGFDGLPLLELPVNQWTPEQQEKLTEAVKKLTDGKTQLDFLHELGLAKKPHGISGSRNGGATEKLTADERQQMYEDRAREDFMEAAGCIRAIGERFQLRTEAELHTFLDTLGALRNAIEEWLKTPASKRVRPNAARFFEEEENGGQE